MTTHGMAQIVLKEGINLRGRDMLPVVMRLTSLSMEEWQKKSILASFTKHPLESYSANELGEEFEKMTSYDIKVSVYCSFSCILDSSACCLLLKKIQQHMISRLFKHKCILPTGKTCGNWTCFILLPLLFGRELFLVQAKPEMTRHII